jgi:Carboxypeptidase regulatory-like domain/TonB dependent receptor/TonB-dependent Receptor Plug Domain
MSRRFATCVRWCVSAFGLLLLIAAILLPSTKAQTQTGTITGTATDASGAVLVGATITVTSEGTGVSQTATTDAQGRYQIALLPVGTYDIEASQTGFQTVDHKGIVLAVGGTPVVDFSLPVGQASTTVTVESQVSQVETQTATVSSLVNESQMHDLPLNGRNFEQLLTLAPGVQQVPQTPAGGGGSATFYGEAQNYSVSGSRPVGQAYLLDNQDLVNFFDHAAGSSVTGNSLGVDAIQEFQVLTNTYSAQFGGTGAVVNAVSRSGTNDLHGSAYDYLRNSVLDARNFFDGTTKPGFRRNQFGGTLGGPIKKDKMFFFVNYEGLRSDQGFTGNEYVPDSESRLGDVPCNTVTGATPATCASGQRTAVPVNPVVVPFLGIYPAANGAELPVQGGPFNGYPSGFALFQNVAGQVVNEDYVLGRMDYTIGSKDTLFGRYVSDRAYQEIPFPVSLLPNWPEIDHSADQFFTLQERHIVSNAAVNEVRFIFTRTNETAATGVTTNPATDPMQFYGVAAGRQDGQIGIGGGGSPIGAGGTVPYFEVQNKFGGGDDLFWTHGSQSIRIGLAVTRVETNIAAPFELGGTFDFGSLPGFLSGVPAIFLGMSNPSPTFTTTRYFREIDYDPYIEDDWKVTSRLTLNLGLRYDFATNAVCAGGVACNAILSPGTSTGFTPVHHVLVSNPNAFNFDPRIGLAWDPFADHKTSIRAGFGIFHEPVAPRTYAPNYYLAPPSGAVLAVGTPFPDPAAGGFTLPYTGFAGLDVTTSVSPYQIQYNLTVQRQITHGTVLSVGYVGSQGVHLFSEVDQNPDLPCSLVAAAARPAYCPATPSGAPGTVGNPFTGSVLNPNFGSLNDDTATSHSTYNSLQASLNHQYSRSFTSQLSYTYSRCIDDGSVSSGLEQGAFEVSDFYDHAYDRGPCTFNVTHAFSANGVYLLPFKGNRVVAGWEFSGILTATSGLPINVLTGPGEPGGQSNLGGIQGDRPDYSGTCPGGKSQILDRTTYGSASTTPNVQWFNPTCYVPEAFGTLGNVGRDSIYGPGQFDLDFSIIKDTKITEKLSTQFRAEFFNILNHTSLGQPEPGVFGGTGGPTAGPTSDGTLFQSATAGQILTTAGANREIQFALKLIF